MLMLISFLTSLGLYPGNYILTWYRRSNNMQNQSQGPLYGLNVFSLFTFPGEVYMKVCPSFPFVTQWWMLVPVWYRWTHYQTDRNVTLSNRIRKLQNVKQRIQYSDFIKSQDIRQAKLIPFFSIDLHIHYFVTNKIMINFQIRQCSCHSIGHLQL